MAFQQTSASDYADLLSVVAAFAVSQGWTKVYDAIASKSQVGLEKGNCHVAIGAIRNSSDTADATTFSRTDLVFGGTLPDAYLVMALSSSLTASNTRYWGHPDSIVTTYSDTDRISINDLYGPMSNVYLFSDSGGNYIHVVVQSSAERFTHFCFGNVDITGFTVPACAYAGGQYHIWWPDSADYSNTSSSNFNDPSDTGHLWWPLGYANLHLFIPSGVLDTGLSWGVTPPVITKLQMSLVTRATFWYDHYNDSTAGKMMDLVLSTKKQATTGGIPLHPISAVFSTDGTNAGQCCYLGEFPDVRFVNMDNLNPGQEVIYGSDTWVVFPWKRKGEEAATNYGANPEPYVNTTFWGLAYKKIV